MKYAPIYIITLNRDAHFIRCLESLKRNTWAKHTDVFIGLDNPPSEKYREGWQRICEYLDKGDFSIFKSFTVLRQSENLGAGKNSLYVRNYLVSIGYDRWIYSEDDIEYSPNFLEYIDKTMLYYENDNNVVAVTGYSYPVKWRVSEKSTCVKENFNCAMWGTGFWLDKYEQAREYIESGTMLTQLDAVLKEKRYKNMLHVSQREYFPQALLYVENKANKMMRVTDVTMRVYLAVAGKYCIMPVITKTRNWGFDGSGLYCGQEGHEKRFSCQSMDTSSTYDPIPNILDNLSDNLELLNNFENTSKKDLFIVRLLMMTIKALGISNTKKLCQAFAPVSVYLRKNGK